MGILDNLRNLMGNQKPDGPDTAPAESAADGEDSYTVQSGDTLWSIARECMGDGSRYLEIFQANRDLLETPEHILPGQKLVIPKLGN